MAQTTRIWKCKAKENTKRTKTVGNFARFKLKTLRPGRKKLEKTWMKHSLYSCRNFSKLDKESFYSFVFCVPWLVIAWHSYLQGSFVQVQIQNAMATQNLRKNQGFVIPKHEFYLKTNQRFHETKNIFYVWFQKSSQRTTGDLKWPINKDRETSIKEKQKKF